MPSDSTTAGPHPADAAASSRWKERLGTFGVWTSAAKWGTDLGAAGATAAELEELGYGAVWLGGSTADLALQEALLAATTKLVVATGIVNVWTNAAPAVAARYRELASTHPGRLLLGLGSSHAPLVEPTGTPYVKPLSRLAAYLDELDSAESPVGAGERVLAALGPRALRLAAERSVGAHPYLVPPEHTADARRLLGPEPLLAPEQKVYLGTDPSAARRVARRSLAIYQQLPNYLRMLRRYGFTDDDFAGEGSDRWTDDLVAWGDAATVRSRVHAHLDAGADHVAVQVLSSGDPASLPRAEWRAVADVLRGA